MREAREKPRPGMVPEILGRMERHLKTSRWMDRGLTVTKIAKRPGILLTDRAF